jgi:tetratricopeptide (TPR) repeat protein
VSFVIGAVIYGGDPKAKGLPDDVPEDSKPDESGFLEKVYRCLAQGDSAGALSLFDRLPETEQNRTSNVVLKASILISADRCKDAASLIDGALSLAPSDTEVLYAKANIEYMSGRDGERKDILEGIIKINDKHVRALCDLGAIAMQKNDIKTAAAFYDRALASAPNDEDALVGRAGVWRYQRRPQEAEALLNKAINLYPDRIPALSLRAKIYSDTGFYKHALADLDRARDLDAAASGNLGGGNYWIAYDRGKVLLDLHRKEEALAEFTRAIKIAPGAFEAYAFSAGIKADAGDHNGAVKDYEALVKINPEYYYGWEGLGFQRMRINDYAGARDAFRKVWEYVPDEFSYAALAAVNALACENLAQVRPFLGEAMSYHKRESSEYIILRLFYDSIGDSDVARKVEAFTDKRAKARAYFYLGKFYELHGKAPLAKVYYEKCVETGRKDFMEWRLNTWALENFH